MQQKQYNTIVNEQRVLNQQLIERNQVRLIACHFPCHRFLLPRLNVAVLVRV